MYLAKKDVSKMLTLSNTTAILSTSNRILPTMSQNQQSPAPSGEAAARQLHEFGRLLDAIECGRIPVNARQYRKAAVYAQKLLRENFDVSEVIETCAISPALSEMRVNIQFERTAGERKPIVGISGLTGTRV